MPKVESSQAARPGVRSTVAGRSVIPLLLDTELVRNKPATLPAIAVETLGRNLQGVTGMET